MSSGCSSITPSTPRAVISIDCSARSHARGGGLEAAMTTPPTTTQDYVCAQCKKKGLGRYLVGGWWQYPEGWFVHDNCDRWACSEACASRASSTPPAPPR